ncbi:unnamed protein product [Alternaria alternata]
MKKNRFSKRQSALSPDWILDGSPSEPATPNTTLDVQTVSRPSSNHQETAATHAAPEDTNQGTSKAEMLSIQDADTASSPILPAQPGQVGTKSRYSRLHQSDWTLSSMNTDNISQHSKKSQGKSRVLSWARKFTAGKVATDKPIEAPSPNSAVPPAPTGAHFPPQSVSPKVERQSHIKHQKPQSPSSGADVPARVPYVASNYTPTSPSIYTHTSDSPAAQR